MLKDKSFDFAVRIVKLYSYLITKKTEYVMSKQVLKCGTSIGANVREAYNAESKKDFMHKLAIAQKECDETSYWLELLKETGFIRSIEFESISKDATVLLKIIRSSVLTAKHNLNKRNEQPT